MTRGAAVTRPLPPLRVTIIRRDASDPERLCSEYSSHDDSGQECCSAPGWPSLKPVGVFSIYLFFIWSGMCLPLRLFLLKHSGGFCHQLNVQCFSHFHKLTTLM